jgi:hypothetical protein
MRCRRECVIVIRDAQAGAVSAGLANLCGLLDSTSTGLNPGSLSATEPFIHETDILCGRARRRRKFRR